MTKVCETKQSKNKPKTVQQCFINSASTVVSDYESNFETRHCPDAVVGKFECVNRKIECNNFYFDKKQRESMYQGLLDEVNQNEIQKAHIPFIMPLPQKYNDNECDKTLVVVLESPHIKEFTSYVMPAMGPTGSNLQRIFKYVLKNFSYSLPRGKYRVIIMNAIQYQCSAGLVLTSDAKGVGIRDNIFLHTWKNNEIRNDFVKRLKSYKPDVVFNLCTKEKEENKDTKGRKLLVQVAINTACSKNCKMFHGYHPSAWRIKTKNVNPKTTIKDIKEKNIVREGEYTGE